MVITFLLSLVLTQEASAYLSDTDLTGLYPAGHSGYSDWARGVGFIENRYGFRYNSWFKTFDQSAPITVTAPLQAKNRLPAFGSYPGFIFRESITGKITVTEEYGRELIYHFPSLSSASFKNADLLFLVTGPSRGSEEVSLLADGKEIFSPELSRRQMRYRVSLLGIAPESLQDGELILKFLAPEGDYIIRQIALNIKATDPTPMHAPIPASLWLLGSGLGILGAIKLTRKFKN